MEVKKRIHSRYNQASNIVIPRRQYSDTSPSHKSREEKKSHGGHPAEKLANIKSCMLLVPYIMLTRNRVICNVFSLHVCFKICAAQFIFFKMAE